MGTDEEKRILKAFVFFVFIFLLTFHNYFIFLCHSCMRACLFQGRVVYFGTAKFTISFIEKQKYTICGEEWKKMQF